mmetsp:Transcript_10541/g.29056  ORF Transcript_10541/g.29056 Transcript_10541/m.29056 type:complete len:82 (+) Transcript_10541:74-319(+)
MSHVDFCTALNLHIFNYSVHAGTSHSYGRSCPPASLYHLTINTYAAASLFNTNVQSQFSFSFTDTTSSCHHYRRRTDASAC